MTSSPVLPVHTQDVEKVHNEKGLEIQLPPPHPRTNFRSPRTPGTGFSGASRISGRSNATDILDNIMSQLDVQSRVFDDDDSSSSSDSEDVSKAPSWKKKINHTRAHLRHILHIPKFHYTIIGLVIFDLIIVFIDLVLSLLNLSCFTEEQIEQFAEEGIEHIIEPASCILHESTALVNGDWFLWAMSVALLSIFVLEIFASLFAFGPRRFYKPLYAIDAVIVIASFILEIYFRFADGGKDAGSSPAALVVLRLWKVIRAIHAVAHSIELKNQSIIHEVREAKLQVEEEHKETTILLKRDQAKIAYLRARLRDVTDVELEQHATLEIERQESAMKKEEEAGYQSDD